MATNKVIVSGKVQGVYFRASAKQKALNLGVNGFVRNESDGTVLLEIEGEQAAVTSMVNWCKHGPGLARISNYEITDEVAKNYVSFDIKK
jgi:acylphosphatase